jgi:Uma2 family endonuclease
MLAPPPHLTLSNFLALPHIDDSPAWEYVNGTISQKPLPKTFHSRLQLKLASRIDQAGDLNSLLELFSIKSTQPSLKSHISLYSGLVDCT